MTTIDARIIRTLTPIFGVRNIYATVTSDVLPKEADGSFTPFCVFSADGGTVLESFARIYDRGKSNWTIDIQTFAPRAARARELARAVETAILESKEFLAARAFANCQDDVDWGMKLFSCSQQFDLWVENPKGK